MKRKSIHENARETIGEILTASTTQVETVARAAEKIAGARIAGSTNGWKCAVFLLIGLAGGYLLSSAKNGIVIGSYNNCKGKLPEKKDGIVIGSYNGITFEPIEEVKDAHPDF